MVGFPPPAIEQGEGGEAGTRVLPLLPAKNGGEMSWVGPWRAEGGIHPGSRNNLLIFFQKGDSLGEMAG